MIAVPLLAALAAGDGTAGGADAAWERFPVLVWRQRWRDQQPPDEVLAPFGGTNVERDDEPEWVFERGLDFYVGHGPGRNVLHLDLDDPRWSERAERWYETRDPELAVREPCLTDPATRARLEVALERSLAARGGRHGLGVSLGDEVSLTPYGNPSDVCRSATCEAAWRERADALDLPARAPTTDETRLALAEGDGSLVGPWLERRRFHRDVLHDLLRDLGEQVRDRGVPVGLLGMAGATAFGNASVDRVAPWLDFAECYAVGDARELLATERARRGGQPRSLRTVFLEGDSPAGAAWQAFEHWMRGGDGLVVWCDADLAELPAHRARLGEAVAAIRRIAAEHGPFRPEPAGVALVRDDDAVALAFLRDALLDGRTWPRRRAGYQEEHGTRERAVRSWLRWLEDTGRSPGSLPIEAVGAGTSERFPALVLVHQAVLSDADVGRLEAHLAAGGRLLVDGELGTLDRAGHPRSDPVLARLRERAPGRVLDATRGLERYLDRRLELDAGARRRAGPELADAAPPLGGLGVAPAGAAARLPWLAARAELSDGRTGVALLPALGTPAERSARLADLRLELEVEDGLEVEWIHPPAGPDGARVLRAGDAAVLAVSRAGD